MGEIYKVGCAEAEMIEDSIGVSNKGIGISSIRVRYPRIIHSELMTHRQFSRNARSSRAVPTNILLKEDPFVPEFLENKAGMQGGDVLSFEDNTEALHIWLEAMESCRDAAKKLNILNVHKQHANRMLEWFGWIDVLITSTNWSNFDGLRDHPDAQPEIRDLAKAIKLARLNSIPKVLGDGQWHLPYILETEREIYSIEDLLPASAARCARISYKPFNQDKINIEEDFKLFEKLVTNKPVHSCYDDKTEVLTNRGWKLFKDINYDDKIAAVNYLNGTFDFETPEKLQVYEFNGDLIEINDGSVNLCVTDNHRILLQKRTSKVIDGFRKYCYGDYKILPASDVNGKQDRYMASSQYIGCPGNGTYDEGALEGFIIGDGFRSYGKISFHLSKKRKVEFITKILNNLSIEYTNKQDLNHSNPETVYISYKRNGKDVPFAYEKRLPYLFDKSVEFLNGLFDGLMNSDGSKHNKNGYRYSTTSKGLSEDISLLATLLNREVRKTNIVPASGNKKILYNLHITYPNIFKTVRKPSERVHYKGFVYCATVSTGMLLVRRNGLQVVCGNSPVEHQATPDIYENGQWLNKSLWGNFFGFVQHRKIIEDECILEWFEKRGL